ncbi:RNA-binding region-containing protein 3 isoform X2 [Hylaeus volcanicus]|uniref:RNA-binding region-containing protein 3 isoform X2 n=1 Tax=Hylaeus volcanicus TaxID=313075 RepID=UPI0023B7E1B1|nr:RNA-binding region-containing protein 3 isoform X2 [Hylaeus volcanicus]
MSSKTAHISDTLRILHLPPELSNERRNELFKKFGAVNTRTLRPSKKYTVTYAKFPSQQAATEALLRLHQLNIRGQYLTVEFAKKFISIENTPNEVYNDKLTTEESKKEPISKSNFQAFLQKLNSWTANQVFSQPPPPNIQYKYLPPTKSTLIRIAIQLVKEPAFYTQVLHLMNKMNLPPPFEELEAEFPLLKDVYNLEKYKNIFEKGSLNDKEYEDSCNKEEEEEEEEEEESEIESDEENSATQLVEIIPVKRKSQQSTKRLKIPKFVNPAKQIAATTSTQKVVKPEDMFEPVQRSEAKNLKIELKTVETLLDVSSREDNVVTENTVDGGFGLMFPLPKNPETVEDESTENIQQEVITSKELADNKISANDQRLLPVFKNYHPGKPSNRLYIKNLAKQVEAKDLHFIYRRFMVPELKTVFEYDVRLMQEGRMKGQAFVTLQNIEQAQLALNQTNGYILKDKPMVVQFAKPAKS